MIAINLLPRQIEALKYIGKGKYIFYGGARGGGKSHLARCAAMLSAAQNPGLRVVAVRTTYPELYEVFISRILTDFPEEEWGYKYRAKERVAIFDNGSMVFFRPIEHGHDLKKVLGLEYQLIVIDEANQLPESYIHKIKGSLRRPVGDFLPTMLMTGNPGGVSDTYFKTRFVAPDYSYWTKAELKEADKYIFVPAKVWDNPFAGEDYIERLKGLADEGLRKKWLDGDWSVISGQFFDMWNPDVHVVEGFDIPSDWHVVVGLDMGRGSHPSAAVWCAQDPDTGNVYVFDELVSYSPFEDFLEEFREVEESHTASLSVVCADPSMWVKAHEKREEVSPAMALMMYYPVVKANNDRVNGWRIVKMWLHYNAERGPALRVFERCTELIRTIPLQQYAESHDGTKEDIDTRKEDDVVDALRYALTSGFALPFLKDEAGKLVNKGQEQDQERKPGAYRYIPEHVLFV
jgi:phage terminase large subunit